MRSPEVSGLCSKASGEFWGVSRMHRRTLASFALIQCFWFIPVLATQHIPEERVVVTASAYPVPFENLSRSVTVFTRDDIERMPVRSIVDVLAHVASVDIRSRAPFGMQADLSIRGSAFSQVLVLIDGVRINDSQTAHHNADFPIQLQDIDRIEVLRGPGSSIYGADALGGIINIITRRSVENPLFSISAGQHGFAEGTFGLGFQKGGFEQSFSATANRSSGFQYDRDFRNISFSSRTRVGGRSDLLVSHVNKAFGANGFYGPSPSKEWTNQTLVSFELRSNGRSDANTIFHGYYRTHGDRFLYDIREPMLFESNHRTHAIGAMAKTRFTLAHTISLSLGGEAGGDWIASSNLGHHSFARTSLFGEVQWTPRGTVSIYPGLRIDYYSNFGASASPSLGASWWIRPRIRIRSSVGHAFRIPTFTELFYRDPNHEASSSLEPESAWSADIGTDFIPAKNWLGSLTFFARREQNVIDWIRQSDAETWRTANIRELRTSGAEIGLERSFGSQTRLEANYSRMSVDAGNIDYLSKYVLDYARDSVSTSAYFPLPFAFNYRQTLSYRRRSDGRSYWLLDGRLECRFRRFTAALEFTNLFNTRYQEVLGVDMPGRWFVLSLSTQ
jgi:outer membrane cobalamin receptor